jgi:hypothetical protein
MKSEPGWDVTDRETVETWPACTGRSHPETGLTSVVTDGYSEPFRGSYSHLWVHMPQHHRGASCQRRIPVDLSAHYKVFPFFSFFLVCVAKTFQLISIFHFGIALGCGLDDRGSRIRFPAGTGNFSLHHRVQNGSGDHTASYPIDTRGSSLEVKRPGREADHSPPANAEVKEWVELYLHSPIRLHGVVLS